MSAPGPGQERGPREWEGVVEQPGIPPVPSERLLKDILASQDQLRAEVAELRSQVSVGTGPGGSDALSAQIAEQLRHQAEVIDGVLTRAATQLAAAVLGSQAEASGAGGPTDASLDAIQTRLADQVAELQQGHAEAVAGALAGGQAHVSAVVEGLRTDLARLAAAVDGGAGTAEPLRALGDAITSVGAQLTRQERAHEQALQAVQARVTDQLLDLHARHAGAIASVLAGAQARVTGTVDSVRADLAKLTATLDRPPEVPEPVRAVAPALATLSEQLAQQRAQQETALRAIEARVDSQLTEHRRALEAQTAAALESLRSAMGTVAAEVQRPAAALEPLLELPAAVAALDGRLAASRREQRNLPAEVIKGIRAEIDRLAETLDSQPALPDAVAALPAALAALSDQVLNERRHQQTLHEESRRIVAAGLGDQLAAHQRALQERQAESLKALQAEVRIRLSEVGLGLQAELATVQELAGRPPAMPEQLRAVPGALTALARAVAQLQSAQDEALGALERRLDARILDQGRDAQERTSDVVAGVLVQSQVHLAAVTDGLRADIARAAELPEPVRRLPDAIAGLAEELFGQLAAQEQALAAFEARLADAIAAGVEGVGSAVAKVGERLADGPMAVPEPLRGLPAAVAAVRDQLIDQQRQQQDDVADGVQRLRADIAGFVEKVNQQVAAVPEFLHGLPQAVEGVRAEVAAIAGANPPAATADDVRADLASLRDQVETSAQQQAQFAEMAAAANAWFVEARDLILDRLDALMGPVAPLLAEVAELRGQVSALDEALAQMWAGLHAGPPRAVAPAPPGPPPQPMDIVPPPPPPPPPEPAAQGQKSVVRVRVVPRPTPPKGGSVEAGQSW